MIDVLIKPVARDDIPLLEKYFPQIKEKHHRRLSIQENDKGTYLIAWYKKMPVGHVLINWPNQLTEKRYPSLPETPRLEDLRVGLAFQRKGIGSTLLNTALTYVKGKGFKQVTLHVNIENQAAQTLYLKKGFVNTGHKPFTERGTYIDEYGNEHAWEETCYLFVKEL